MKQSSPTVNTKPRSRWVIIGPGVILALIFGLQMAINNHKVASAPPIIERQVIGGNSTQKLITAPEISYILAHNDQLHLSSRQKASLNRLQDDWAAKSKPLTVSMDRAVEEFNAFMKSAGNRASMREIQSHAAPVSESSREFASLRRIYWEKALQELDKEQRAAINQEMSHSNLNALDRGKSVR